MRAAIPLALYGICVFVSGCTSLEVGGELQSGRRAWFAGDNETALAYFQSAAHKDPSYVYGTALQQGIWSYVGRAEYAVGQFPQARQSLERALSLHKPEDIARLYFGLTLARSGEPQRGLVEIESGMKGIHSWLEYITNAYRFSFGQFWDPGRNIRAAIEGDLAMLSGKDVDWQKLMADGEWLGRRMEVEIDRARRQESQARSRDGNGRGDNR
jgi:tetratricopeptide (TPR) repeat protein